MNPDASDRPVASATTCESRRVAPDNWFVAETNPLRQIWAHADTIMVIFAGSAGEFALNKAVDWLYFTGKLPNDPLGRMFSTVAYARRIIFAERPDAEKTIRQINDIHRQLEQSRRQQIPAWAYRDVLYMLIHYSVAAAALLQQPLTNDEAEEVYTVFREMGTLMEIPGLPIDYRHWLIDYERHLEQDLAKSAMTADLFCQYRKHLGPVRHWILLQTQSLVAPPRVGRLLSLPTASPLRRLLPAYRWLRCRNSVWWVQWLLVPPLYRQEIAALEVRR